MSSRSYFCVVSIRSGRVVSRHNTAKAARRSIVDASEFTISEGSWAVGEDVTRDDR